MMRPDVMFHRDGGKQQARQTASFLFLGSSFARNEDEIAYHLTNQRSVTERTTIHFCEKSWNAENEDPLIRSGLHSSRVGRTATPARAVSVARHPRHGPGSSGMPSSLLGRPGIAVFGHTCGNGDVLACQPPNFSTPRLDAATRRGLQMQW